MPRLSASEAPRSRRYRGECSKAFKLYYGDQASTICRQDHRAALVHISAALNGANYTGTTLQPHVVPLMQNHLGYILQQDNAPVYRVRETPAYLAGQQIGVVHPWPVASPDMNPIEHVSDFLGRHIRAMNPAPQNNAKLI
ncbi:transposable element tcb1 transposase [Plakobranchus ocellatus]|uniref:Transposable element tcb1 transposase n=1 Tax=Plakobranchus ocellatus TaxID=259542 RepID=A0AAV4BR69_9GAST|nr:transposable element tcb1 transposase [Plakobranchus ocellatus]